MKDKELSKEDLIASENLKEIWLDYKEDNGVNQADICKKLGWTQGYFSMHINARLPITLRKLIIFAEVFNVNCSDIRPDVADKVW